MTHSAWAATVQLTDASQIEGFTCGRSSVDGWLQDKAVGASPHVLTQLYVDYDSEVMAFAATTMVHLVVDGATSAQRFGQREGRSVGFMLAQMGVRSDLSGQGIGSAVMKDIMGNAAVAYRQAPFPLFVVEAADESLVPYYAQFGLRPLRNNLRLTAPMRTLVASIP